MMNNTNQPTAKQKEEARDIVYGHRCPDCSALCECGRGTVNPKDCVHMECVTGIPDAELERRLLSEIPTSGFTCACCLRGMELRVNGKFCNECATGHSSRDREIREVLEGLRDDDSGCWCVHFGSEYHTNACLAARALWERV